MANWQLYRSFLHEPDTIDSVESPGGDRLRTNFRRVADALIARSICVTDTPYGADATGATPARDIIQSALDDAGDAGGGVVLVPWGTYSVAGAAITIPSNVSLISYGATFQVEAGRTACLFDVDGKTNVRLSDFSITKASGAAVGSVAYGVTIRGASSDVIVERVSVDAMQRGINIAGGEGTVAGVCRRIDLVRCTATNSPLNVGFNLDDCDDVLLDRCRAYFNGLDGFKVRKAATNWTLRKCVGDYNGQHVVADGCDTYAGGGGGSLIDCLFRNNTAQGCTIKTGDLTQTDSANYGYIEEIRVVNMRTENNAGPGLYIAISDPTDTAEPLVAKVVVDGGIFKGDQNGIYCSGRNVTINFPEVVKSLQHGIVTGSRGYDIEINHAVLVACGQSSSGTYSGIDSAAARVRINFPKIIGVDMANNATDAQLSGLTPVTKYGVSYTGNGTHVMWPNATYCTSHQVIDQAGATGGDSIVFQARAGDPLTNGAYGGPGSLYLRTGLAGGTNGADALWLKVEGDRATPLSGWIRLGAFVPVDALPTAAVGLRGATRLLRNGAGVADTLHVCRKNAADAYEWRQFTTT